MNRLLPAVALLAAGLVGCTTASSDGWPDAPGPKVVTSFAPIECFARNVAGGDAVVRSIMSTQGPHHFDPSPSDARALTRADRFFINGLGLDDGMSKRLMAGSGKTNAKLVPLATRLDESTLLVGGCNHDHGHGHQHHDHGFDPHVWLGMPHAEKMVGFIRDELKLADPPHAAEYDRRAAEYVARLNKLKDDGVAMFQGKKDKQFVVFHESLNYFAKTYGLTVAGVVQETPGHEPTPKQLDELVKLCVEKKVRVIAVEPQYSSKTAAERIVAELKRKGVEDPVLVTIDPLETCPPADMSAEWYEAKMRQNLTALAGALK
jgi:zinc transport system substrate-binding protein